MISLVRRHQLGVWVRVLLAVTAALALLAGCGGGGGGGGSTGGGTTAGVATLTGTLQDKTTGILLQNRTVTVQGTGLSGVSNAQGQFSIAGVPTTTVTLIVTDSVGVQDGTIVVNVGRLSGGATRTAGSLILDLGALPAPPPIL
jgi:hypothetical protein